MSFLLRTIFLPCYWEWYDKVWLWEETFRSHLPSSFLESFNCKENTCLPFQTAIDLDFVVQQSRIWLACSVSWSEGFCIIEQEDDTKSCKPVNDNLHMIPFEIVTCLFCNRNLFSLALFLFQKMILENSLLNIYLLKRK